MNTIIKKIRALIKMQIRREELNFSSLGGGGQTMNIGALEWVLKQLDTLQEQPVCEGEEEEYEQIKQKVCSDCPSHKDDYCGYVKRQLQRKCNYLSDVMYGYELGRQSKLKVRFPHEKDIVDKVFGAGNLDGWEYDEAKALVALAKEELLKDIKPKVCDGLDEEIKRWLKEGEITDTRYDDYIDNDIESTARHFAKWGAEHRGSSEIPNDLEEAARKHSCYDEDCEGAWYEPIVRNAFIAGAKWQKEQMISALKNDGDLPIEFIDKFHEIDRTAFQNGQKNMKEQLMKEAVEGEVVTTNKYTSVRYLSRYGTFRYFYGIGGGFQKGDKVRVIVCKKED